HAGKPFRSRKPQSGSRGGSHRRRSGGFHNIDAAGQTWAPRGAVRTRAFSTISYWRVADPGNLLGAQGTRHVAEDEGQSIREKGERPICQLTGSYFRTILLL